MILMRWLYLVFCLLGSTMVFCQSVVEMYQLLSEYDHDVKMHKIYQKGEKWYASNADNESIEALVDAKNNVIVINDKKKNSAFNIQLSLLKSSNKEVFIALIKNYLDPFLHGEVHILEYKNGRFFDLSDKMLPNIQFSDFIEADINNKNQSASFSSIEDYIEIGYHLTNRGKSIRATMQTNVIKKKCKDKEQEFELVCASLQEIKRSKVLLNWINKERKFNKTIQ